MSPHGTIPVALVALAAGVLLSTARAQQEAPSPPTATRPAAVVHEMPPEARRAVEDGLAWLARQQRQHAGSWGSADAGGRYDMSVTALAGLAFLAHGDTPETGPYAETLRRCLVWVLDAQAKYEGGPYQGLLCDLTDPTGSDDRPMHGHGFALLLLASAYGQTRDPHLRERLHRGITAGVRLTERTISRDGGWYYYPGRRGGGLQDEGSVTVTQMQALRAARNAGIDVDPTVVQRAVDYIHGSQVPSGGIRYTLHGGDASAALTAAGISVLHGAGEYSSKVIDKAYAYLRQYLTTQRNQRFFYYTHLYASQAMFHRGGPEWASYLPRIRRELLDMQGRHTYWEATGLGKVYATSIALLILELPLRYLPIHQR